MVQFKKIKIDSVVLAYLVVCLVWGSTYLAISIGVAHMPPLLFAGTRFIIASVLMFSFVAIKRYPWPTSPIEWRNQAIVGLLLLLGGNGFVVLAQQWISSGSASIMVATSPLFMALIEYFIPNRPRLDFSGWIGLFVGFMGVVYLVFSGKGDTGIDPLGGFFMVLAAFSWALGSTYSKGFKTTGSIYAGIGIQMLAGGCGQIIVGLTLGEASRFTLHPTGLMAMLYLILFGSIVGYSSYIYVLQKWPAAKAGSYAYINPLVAVLLGSLILNEPFTLNIVIGASIILLGVFLVQRSKTKTVSPPKASN